MGKVAPQVIGQSQPKKFCETIGIEYTTISDLKKHIQTKIVEIIPSKFRVRVELTCE